MLREMRCVAGSAAALALATLIASCGSSQPAHRPARPTHVLSVGQRLNRLRNHLPYGFTAPGHSVGAQAATKLAVAPASALRMSQITLRAMPSATLLREASASVINEPDRVVLSPLFTSSQAVSPGAKVIVAATKLGALAHHAALLVLQGPGGRFQDLLAVRSGVAAGVVSLPTTLKAGSYFLVVEDLSELDDGAGQVLADIGLLSVS